MTTLLFNELPKIGCTDTSQQEKLLANSLSKRRLQILKKLLKMRASLDQGDDRQPLVVGEAEAEEIFVAEVVVKTTVLVPQVAPDHRVQVEDDPELLQRIYPRWPAKALVGTVVKMGTKYAIATSILTINVSCVDSLGTSHEIAMVLKRLEDEAEVEADLGVVVAEDEDVALFEEGEVVKAIMLEKELWLNHLSKKIPLLRR